MSDTTETTEVVTTTAAAEVKAFEVWAREKQAPDFLVAAAKVRFHWGQGREMSAADFDAAIDLVANIRINVQHGPTETR